MATTGLRERKKQQTRDLIAATANRLFAERGFDAVTVADVAREAEVSAGTVFNYFPTKEDLFYGRMETFEAALIQAVRDRPQGTSALATFREIVLRGVDDLASRERGDLIETAARIISASPALQAREREVVAQYTDELAKLLREETKNAYTVESWAVANALMGAQRALVVHVREQVLAGRRGSKLVAETKAQGRRTFARLETGLGDYAVER